MGTSTKENQRSSDDSQIFGFSSPNKVWESLGKKLDHGFYIFLTVAGTVLLTLGGAFANGYSWSGTEGAWETSTGFWNSLWAILSNPYIHLVAGPLLFSWGAIGTYKDFAQLDKKNRTLERYKRVMSGKKLRLVKSLEESELENNTLNAKLKSKHAQLVETWLNGAFTQLLEVNTHARVSIYYYYQDAFYILARFSPNGHIGRIHNQKFALNKGVISQVYRHLECHEVKAPSHGESPEEHKKYMMENYEYTEEQLSEFNMKSCRYFGQAIREADSVIGIILYESDHHEDLIDKDLITRIKDYNKNYWSHLCQFVRHGLELDLSAQQHESSSPDLDALAELGGRRK